MKKKKILVIVDMQEDFVTGALGNPETQAVVPRIVKKLQESGKKYSAILLTKDAHNKNYGKTLEGKKLPIPHCIEGTDGYRVMSDIYKVVGELRETGITVKNFKKHTFASDKLVEYLTAMALVSGKNFEIEIIGVCTDICVVSNALTIRAALPNTVISVDPKCCAGTSIKAHNAALRVMNSCQINTGRRYGKPTDTDMDMDTDANVNTDNTDVADTETTESTVPEDEA